MKTELRDSDPGLRKKMGRKNPREIEKAGSGSEPAAVGRSARRVRRGHPATSWVERGSCSG